MTTKSTDIENIKKHINNESDVYRAVETWCSSYHYISTKEFVDCCEGWNINELLDILNDKIKILTVAEMKLKCIEKRHGND